MEFYLATTLTTLPWDTTPTLGCVTNLASISRHSYCRLVSLIMINKKRQESSIKCVKTSKKLWDALEKKYKTEDAKMNKFIVENVVDLR